MDLMICAGSDTRDGRCLKRAEYIMQFK